MLLAFSPCSVCFLLKPNQTDSQVSVIPVATAKGGDGGVSFAGPLAEDPGPYSLSRSHQRAQRGLCGVGGRLREWY